MATSSRLLASCSSQRGIKRKFPDEFPSFCVKIVTNEDLRDGKELPETTVMTYGDCMDDHIFLEVPNCGKPWQVELRKSALGGRIWLLKGWEEFANFYSLDQGCFPVFSYEGKQSHFQVRIFHWKQIEIDYPIRGRGTFLRTMASTGKREGKGPVFLEDSPSFILKIVTDDDLLDGKELPEPAVRKYRNCMADYLLLEVPNCEKSWKLELRRSTRGGRMWLNKGWQEFANFYSLDEGCLAVFSYEGKHSHFQVRIFHWNDMELDYPIHGGGVAGRPKWQKPGANQDMVPAILEPRATSVSTGSSSADEHQNDLPSATSFKSDEPFFIVNMRASYINGSFVHINKSFAKEHLCRPGTSWDVTLQISGDERVWTAVCISSKGSDKRIYTKLTGAGWKAFQQDNHLVKGVICAFELIEERTFKVSIFRKKRTINRKTEERVMEIDYPIHGEGNDGTPKGKSPGATQDVPPAHLEARANSVSSGSPADEDQNDLVTATYFKSDKPIFMLNVTAIYMHVSHAYISASFAAEHLCKPGTSCNVTLQMSDEKVWTAQCFVSEHSAQKASLSGPGWKTFTEDNHLELGDVCVFELIDERKLKVSIFQGKVKIIRSNGHTIENG